MTTKLFKVCNTHHFEKGGCTGGSDHVVDVEDFTDVYPMEDFDKVTQRMHYCARCGADVKVELHSEVTDEVYGLVGLIFANNRDGAVAHPVILSEYIRMSFCFSAEGFNSEHGKEVSVEMETSNKDPLWVHLNHNQKRPTILLLKDAVRDRYMVYRWKYADDQDVNEAIVHVADCLVCV